MIEEKEEWRIIPESKGWYEISNLGRVRSWFRNKWGRLSSPRIKKPSRNKQGHLWITIRTEQGKPKKHYIHSLVIHAFLRESNLEVNHINSDPSDNRLCNLEYVTRQENITHAVNVLGKNRGEKASGSKLTEQDVWEIKRRLDTGEMQKHIASDLGVLQSTISDIATGRGWSWLTNVRRREQEDHELIPA
jgi:predicted XRE-type DNA-binding protein